MNPILKVLAAFVFVVIAFGPASAKDWRGFVPLHSTRDDVHRILGAPQPPPDDRATNYEQTSDSDSYFLPDGEVHFVYATERDQQGKTFPVLLKAETLLLVRFTPDHPLAWNEVSLFESDFRNYTPEDADENWNHGYADDAEGSVVSLFAGKIIELVYIPRIEDRMRFPGYLEDPEQIVKVQNYGQEPDSESARQPLCTCYISDIVALDRFAYELAKTPDLQGYIITYTDRDGRPESEPDCRKNALTYLSEKHNISSDRLVFIDGGLGLDTYMELWLVPPGDAPPIPTPNGENMPGPGICDGIID